MKPVILLLIGIIASLSLARAADKPDKEKLKAEIVAVEAAFAQMAKDKGVLAAFEHFAAPDVSFIDTDPRKWRGPEAVRHRMGGTPAGLKLTWAPVFVDVSDDGTLAFDYGRYESRLTGADGKESVRTGFFLTIWKRQPDRSWRYVTDQGAPDKQ